MSGDLGRTVTDDWLFDSLISRDCDDDRRPDCQSTAVPHVTYSTEGPDKSSITSTNFLYTETTFRDLSLA